MYVFRYICIQVITIEYKLEDMEPVTQSKSSMSLRIDSGVLSQIKEEAYSKNRSLSNYVETLLYRMGYRPHNEETIQACKDARERKIAGKVDTSNLETIEASLFDDEA